MPRLAGRVAFITGAGNGIRATAILFACEGARVAIAEIDAWAGEETAHLAGNETIAIRADVTDPDSLQSAIRATVDKLPPRRAPQQCRRLYRAGRHRGQRPAR
jgi:NAD(P)-dependent dehydrogenase (short-subunit alcohol dehydrogenase family)